MARDLHAAKRTLRERIARARVDGTYADDDHAQLLQSIEMLEQLTPMPRPIDEQARVAGVWRTLFAQFGPRHTAGKPVSHVNRLNLLTFARFPDRPVRVTAIDQEIHHGSLAYNNVHCVESVDGQVRTLLTVYGRYRIDPGEPKRYVVDFHRAGFLPDAAADDVSIRAAFELDPDQPLSVDLKPPKLSSDITFCDDELRINRGSMGGIYVLERLVRPGRSVTFD